MSDPILKQKGDVLAEVAAILSGDDEFGVVPTLVELGIRRAVKDLAEQEGARKQEMRIFVDNLRAEMLKTLEAEGKALAERVKTEVQLDLDRASASAATLVANVNQAHSRAGRMRSLAFGMLIAAGLLGAGILIGKYLSF